MTYRNPPVFEFKKLEQLTCFTGNNGHGKSSLIDSFTWCLWGEVFNRKPAGVQGKIDQALLTVGESNMFVEAVFEQNGETYKAIRSYSKGRYKEKRSLDVFCWRDGNWVSLSSDYSSLNEREILQQIVPITYQTFINTSYLVQGKYDEFTKKSPSKRKDLIIPLVVHPIYATIHDQAKAVKRELTVTEATIGDKIREIQTILETRSNIQDELNTINTSLEATQAARDESYQKLQALIQVHARLKAQSEQEQQAQKRLVDVQKSIQRVQNQIYQATIQIGNLQTVVDKKDEIESAYKAYQREKEEMQELHRYELEYRDILRTVEQKTHAYSLRLQKVQYDISNLKERIATLNEVLKKEDTITASYAEYQRKEVEAKEYNHKAVLYQEACTRRDSIKEKVRTAFIKLQSDLESFQKQLATYPELSSIKHSKLQVQQAIAELEQQRNILHTLNTNIDTITKSIDTKTTQLTDHKITVAMQNSVADQVYIILNKLKRGEVVYCPICLQHVPNKRYNDLQHNAENLAKQCMHFTTEESRLTEEIEQLKLQQETLKSRKTDIEEVLKHTHEQQALLQHYEKEETTIVHLIEQIERIKSESSQEQLEAMMLRATEAVEAEIAEIGFDSTHVKALERYLIDNASVKHTISILQKAKQDIEIFTQKLVKKTKEFYELKQKFETKDHVRNEQKQIDAILAKVHEYGCTVDDIDTKRRSLQQKKDVPERYQILQSAITNLETSQTYLNELNQQMEGLNEQMSDLQKMAAGIETTIESIKTVEQNKAQEEQKYSDFQKTENRYLTVKGELQERLDFIARKKAEQEDLYKQLFEVQKQLILNTSLIEICGREGIPTHLLKQTIQAVEFEANNILDRITDGTTRLRLETEKKLKSGDMRDTLDIKIQTDGFDRYYEPYSGGQKFRIDFALRIGLSKVLATQAGNPLEFLVIDEGFGTQDDNGLIQVVQALKEIQNDFKQVVIITHIKNFQELFGTRVNFQLDPVKGTLFSYV